MPHDARLYALARLAQQKAIKARRRRTGKAAPAHGPSAEVALSPTQRAGRNAENLASHYLRRQGLVVIARNLRCKAGEIDLVARDGAVLAFIEVRHRHSLAFGGAAASVNRNKQARLIRCAQFFLPQLVRRHFQGGTPACRFDVVCVEPGGLAWIKNAFSEQVLR